MSVSIKTVFDGNIHRFNLTKPSYDELEVALNSIYGKRGFSIRYQDEDGDMINVSSSLELQEALRVAGGKTLKLVLSLAGGDAFVCVNEPAVVHVEPETVEAQAETKAPEPVQPEVESPKPETKTEEPKTGVPEPEKKCDAPEFNCEEFRVLACQFLSDPAVQVILPDLAKAAITQVVEGARSKKDPQEAAARVLEVFTANNVIQNHPAMAAVHPFLGKVQGVVAHVFENIPPAFVDLLDRLKDGFQLNADMLMSLLSNPFPNVLDCGKFDLGSLGISLGSLPAFASMASFPFGPFEFGFECKSPCQPNAPAQSKEGPDTHSNVRCDGCGVCPIVGPRYNCTVCPDFDLCGKCEGAAIHPAEHPLLKMRQAASQVVVHHGITCDGCNQSPITGVRFKCRTCHDFDLCEACEAKNTHPADHPLVKFKTPKERGRHGGHGFHGFGRPPFHKLFEHAFNPEFLARGFPCHGRRRFLARGSIGEAVKEIQQALGIQVDGFFGPKTEQAVKDFQAANSLDADGLVGPRTRAKLIPAKPAETKTEQPQAEPKVEPKVESNKPVWWLSRGAVGEAVKELQAVLGGVPVDGIFGPRTEQAVKAFQTANSLDADGIVGPRTRAKLFPSPEKKEAPKPVAASAPPAAEVDPALAQLAAMGFPDAAVNARLVKKHNGDLELVVAELLGA